MTVAVDENRNKNKPLGIARRKVEELSESDRSKLDGYYVRLRYNDKVMTVPGCKPTGKHLDGDESFCTLVRLNLILMTPGNTHVAIGTI